jgi:hypothetical protein
LHGTSLSGGSVRTKEQLLAMSSSCCEFHTLEELREFVVEILCEHCQLQVGAYQVTQRVLVRNRRPCGILFCLHGPRAVKFTAIWETDQNRVLFYGSSGERFHKIQLIDAPRLEYAA